MLFKAVIFDRDGTIFDSLPVILRAFNYGIEPFTTRIPSNEEWFAAFGPHEPEVMAVFIPEVHKETAYRRFLQYYSDHFTEVSLYPGMRTILERLNRAGVKLALFTGAGRETAVFSLEKEKILPYFSVLVTGDSVSRPKPDPEGIHQALKSMNVDANDTLVVGDSGADVLAGSAAGAKTVLARWGGAPLHDRPSKPDYIFSSISEFELFLF
jgi:phosphoglycolate phosphatase/pyrophosphatase PpaX